MIRIGVFTEPNRDPKPVPVIIKTQGAAIGPELMAKIASSLLKEPNKNQ